MGSIPFHSTVPPNPLLSPRLQDVSCCLPALAPSASRQVLSALLPLVPLNSDFARHLLLLLRKQLVAPEPRARALAVFGFCAALHRRHLPIEPGAHADAVMALRSACSISPALQSRTFGELAPLLATQHSEASTQIQGGRPEDSDTCQENESARVSLMATILEHLHSLSPPTDPALVDPKRAVNPHTAVPSFGGMGGGLGGSGFGGGSSGQHGFPKPAAAAMFDQTWALSLLLAIVRPTARGERATTTRAHTEPGEWVRRRALLTSSLGELYLGAPARSAKCTWSFGEVHLLIRRSAPGHSARSTQDGGRFSSRCLCLRCQWRFTRSQLCCVRSPP